MLPLQWHDNSLHSPVGPWVCLFYVFMIYPYIFCHVLFNLGQLSHFPSCFGAGIVNLNEPRSSFFATPLLWVIRFRAIVNKKQCETSGLFMSLVNHNTE